MPINSPKNCVSQKNSDIKSYGIRYKNRLVELIVLPFDSEKDGKQSKKREDPALRRFAGAWAGEPLVRADQGQYEVREELL